MLCQLSKEGMPRPMPTCIICGSQEVAQLHASEVNDPKEVSFSYSFKPENRKTFAIQRCKACSHVFAHPLPKDIYSNYIDVVDDEYLRHQRSRELSFRAILGRLKPGPGAARLLDVGCATGDLIGVAKAMGFEPEGLELSNWSLSIAQKRGFVVHKQLLSDFANKPENQNAYDFITLIGVIEHFVDPRAELENIYKLLKPNGTLLLWTGDVDSITSKVLQKRWWYWQGQHIQYFTRRSLDNVLQQSHFTNRKFLIYPFFTTKQTLANSLNRYKLGPFIAKLTAPFFALKKEWVLRIPGEMLSISRKATSGQGQAES